MIKNWEQKSVNFAYDNLKQEDGTQPSDIDMFYVLKNDSLILGEFKNSIGEYTKGQRYIHQKFIDNYEPGGYILYIEHNNRVEDGSYEVDASECNVKEYYRNGKWKKVVKELKVKQAFDLIIKDERE